MVSKPAHRRKRGTHPEDVKRHVPWQSNKELLMEVQLDAQDYVFPVEARNIFENKNIIKAIHASQHTQRNYDLERKILLRT